MKAGAKLLAQKGYEGFTVAEVSRKAKVSVGSVYGRFESKDALVYAIHRRMLERLSAPVDVDEQIARNPDLDLPAAITEAVRVFAAGMDSERDLLRAFMLRGAVDPRIHKPGSGSSRQAARGFKAVVLARRNQIDHPDPELAADIAFRMVYDVLARHVMYGPAFESDTKRSWDELVTEITRAALAYLTHGGHVELTTRA